MVATDVVGGEAQNEVGVGQWPVLNVLALKQDGATSFDPSHSAVAESHNADDACVEVGEESA